MVEEQRTREEENIRRQQEAMQVKMQRQEEELRRRQQENTLFMQVKFDFFSFSVGIFARPFMSYFLVKRILQFYKNAR